MAGKKEAKKVSEKRQVYGAAPVKTEDTDKTLRDLQKANASLRERVKALEERVKVIETALPIERAIILRAISKEEAEKEICNLFAKGGPLYYSDIAERLNLDLEMVVNVCNELQKRGEIKVHDNALQSGRRH